MSFDTIPCTLEIYDEETDACEDLRVEATFEVWGDEPDTGTRAGYELDYCELENGIPYEPSEEEEASLNAQFEEWAKAQRDE